MKSKIEATWTKDEFHAFLCIYCVNADYKVTEQEQELMTSKIDKATCDKMQKEFDDANDYGRIEKIRVNFENLGYSNDEVTILFDELSSIFNSDGEFNILEKNIFRGLKKVLR